jgi:hypothetical protein
MSFLEIESRHPSQIYFPGRTVGDLDLSPDGRKNIIFPTGSDINPLQARFGREIIRANEQGEDFLYDNVSEVSEVIGVAAKHLVLTQRALARRIASYQENGNPPENLADFVQYAEEQPHLRGGLTIPALGLVILCDPEATFDKVALQEHISPRPQLALNLNQKFQKNLE